MEHIKPQEQQNIFDLAIQGYGSIEGVFDIMNDNNIDELAAPISVYENYEINNLPIKRNIKEFYEEREVLPATGATAIEFDFFEILKKREGIGVMIIEEDFVVAEGQMDTALQIINGQFTFERNSGNLESLYIKKVNEEGNGEKIQFGNLLDIDSSDIEIYEFQINVLPNTLYEFHQVKDRTNPFINFHINNPLPINEELLKEAFPQNIGQEFVFIPDGIFESTGYLTTNEILKVREIIES